MHAIQVRGKPHASSTRTWETVTAWLDFECHRRAEGGLRDAFAALNARYGISDHISVEDIANYFAWPMFMANPGANFTYLWGAAWSCAAFEPFLEFGLDEAAIVRSAPRAFDPCLRTGAPMAPPDPKAVFRFYAETLAPRVEGAT